MVNFILGIIFICVILPLIQNIMSIIANGTQYINAAIASKTRKNFSELFKDREDEDNNSNPIGFDTNAIGFEMNDNEEEYENDEEEEDE